VHTQHASDFSQGASVEIIRRQHHAVFGGERDQSGMGGRFKARIRGRNRLGLRSGELATVFAFFVETDQALGAAVAIDKFLREDGAKPAFERSAAGEGG